MIPLGRISWAVSVKLALPNGDPLYVASTHLIAATPSQLGDQAQAVDVDVEMRKRVAADGVNWEAAFSFDTPGNFTYSILNNAESPNPYRAQLNGSLNVQQTGY